MASRLIDLLKLDHPIIQAPMAGGACILFTSLDRRQLS